MDNILLNSNWIDLIIILILLYYIWSTFRSNFWHVLGGFLSFTFSLIFALRFYSYLTEIIRVNFNITRSVANALGFMFTAILTEALLGLLFVEIVNRLPKKLINFKYSRILAIFPALGEGLVLVAFIVTLSMGLPISPVMKDNVASSKIGGRILAQTSSLNSKISEIFGGVIEDSLTHLTIKPGSNESVELQVESLDLTVDTESEQKMLELVNTERAKNGVSLLVIREEVVPVARMHARDMWERKYFSHFSPEGFDIGDRLANSGVGYIFAGENLALAPTLTTAHTGLMNSEGHRANILEEDFRQIGIGVIDNGVYGKMFVQVFTD